MSDSSAAPESSRGSKQPWSTPTLTAIGPVQVVTMQQSIPIGPGLDFRIPGARTKL